MKFEYFCCTDELTKAIEVLKPEGQLFEVRVLSNSNRMSGYFRTAGDLIKAMESTSFSDDSNFYYTLNCIDESPANLAALNMENRLNCFSKGNATSDSNISRYQWMMIDLDPERKAGTSSSKEELQAAKNLGAKVFHYLNQMGFPEPLKALSGNGVHLLYRIDIENNPENRELVKRCLEAVADLFNTHGDAENNQPAVKIDTVNYNPARICKLYGTVARKGTSTEERPHRLSKIYPYEEIQITPRPLLEKLAADVYHSQTVKQAKPQGKLSAINATGHGNSFDLKGFLAAHGVSYRLLSGQGRDNSDIYSLDACPFNPEHRNGDAKLFQYPDGAISFKCHHNSCSGYHWQEFRLHFDPNAYDWDDIVTPANINYTQPAEPTPANTLPPIVRGNPFINPKPLSEELIKGVLRKGHKAILTADSKAGKTFLQIELAAAIASGTEWLGYKCEKGKVLYCNFEVDGASFDERLRKVWEALKLDQQYLLSIDRWHLRGYSMSMAEFNSKLLQVLDTGEYAAVILDPIYKLQAGDENAAADIAKFCNELDRVTNTGAAVVYAHHHAKGAQQGKKATDRGSGSGVFSRDPDAIIDLLTLDPSTAPGTDWDFDIDGLPLRVEMSLREFKNPPRMNIVFKYPIHIPGDERCESMTAEKSATQKGGEASGKNRAREAEDRRKEFYDWFVNDNKGKPIAQSVVTARFAVSESKVKSWADTSGLIIDGGKRICQKRDAITKEQLLQQQFDLAFMDASAYGDAAALDVLALRLEETTGEARQTDTLKRWIRDERITGYRVDGKTLRRTNTISNSELPF